MKSVPPVCSECVITWLLFGDDAVCLACQAPVVWIGPTTDPKEQR